MGFFKTWLNYDLSYCLNFSVETTGRDIIYPVLEDTSVNKVSSCLGLCGRAKKNVK